MKMKCEVIQDLLPLYCDHQASQESCRLIEEHLQECDSCRQSYEEMAEQENPAGETVEKNLAEMDPLKKIRRTTRMKIIAAVLASVAVVSFSFYFLFARGLLVSSADMEIRTSAFMDKDDDGTEYYNIQFDFDLKDGNCINVRGVSPYASFTESSKVILEPYSQIRLPFDDRGENPGCYTTWARQDTPFTDEDILIIQYKDRSVEYHLKDIAEQEGIQ